MRDSLLRVIAPALPLQQLLDEGPDLARRLRERSRQRKPQMTQLVSFISQSGF